MENLKISAKTPANKRLIKGPENEIKAASRLGSFKLKGSYLTGLAQPNGITGAPSALKITRTRRRVVPTGS